MRNFYFLVSSLLLFFIYSPELFAQQAKSFSNFIYNDSCFIAEPNKQVIVGEISLSGNKVTHDRIIYREMEIFQGDTLTFQLFCNLAMQSRTNLLNRGLFNFVTIDTSYSVNQITDVPTIDLEYKFIEMWYVWPLPIFELADRNFNSWIESRDWTRVNYGVFITHNNFRGRMEKLKLLLRAGYNQNYMLRYEIPYLTSRQDFGLGIWAGYSRSREIPYAIANDKQVRYKDENAYTRNEYYANVLLTYRQGYRNLHTLLIGYEGFDFADTLIALNNDFTSLQRSKSSYFILSYQFKHDRRDHAPYPLSGYYFELDFNKRGIGFPHADPNFHYLKTTFDFYKPISKRWFWASNVTSKFSGGGHQPFHMRRGMGFGNDFVRTFELYVIDGENFGISKNNLKFAVLTPRVSNINIINNERFSKIHYAVYANLFFDAGYTGSKNPWPDTRMQNQLIYGGGIGLDFVTYYDMVFRMEYGINKFRELGFFIHFVAPI
jgi:outer membrane protein assembly factor BamA